MAAPLGEAVDFVMVQTHLGVTDATHPAGAAAGIMVHHDAVADPHRADPRSHFGHDATGFVPADG
jgi:hypothetical protein